VDEFIDESMTEMYIYEVSEMLTKIEQILIDSDLEGCLSVENILVLFRLMHSLKSSARAMGYKVSSELAHKVEDLLKYVEKSNKAMKDFSAISDISLSCVDYFRLHIHKIKSNEEGEDDATYLFDRIDNYFESLNNVDENTLKLDEVAKQESSKVDNSKIISQKKQSTTLEPSKVELINSSANQNPLVDVVLGESQKTNKSSLLSKKKIDSIISVKMDKLDSLMNLVGEMVIAEPLVTESKEIDLNKTLQFSRDAARLHKMIIELQNIVMSIRMVTVSSTMVRMNRILHDMNKQFHKSVELEVIGEDTEVDKNVIDSISDPLMHILRNSLDHGIESEEERIKLGKNPNGKIILEARNIGSNVLISVSDDGRGMDTLAIYEQAKKQGLITKPYDSMSDQELFNITLLAGFTTNDEVTKYSGRGVGMDVVLKNIQSLCGTIKIYSEKNLGTTIVLKIPLLLSIVEAMNIRINKTLFTIPIDNVVETFRARQSDFVIGPNDDKLIKVRENLYPLLSLNKVFNLETKEMDMNRGIFIVAETEGETFCIYCDEIIGQYSVVAKAIPDYLQKYKEIDGIAGCTIMRDGQISLILDCYAIIKIVKHISGVKSAK
jgi:two-component system chemotaxis sensor kinase CheA